MRSYRKQYRNRYSLPEDAPLQITSMADVFMILLVFLLKTYSTGISSIDPPQGMRLPEALKAEKIVEALKVEISEGSIRLDGMPVLSLSNYLFHSGDLDNGGAVVPLRKKFAQLMNRKGGTAKGTLLVLADQRTPYATLKTVMNTAATTGWRDFKLVVVEDR